MTDKDRVEEVREEITYMLWQREYPELVWSKGRDTMQKQRCRKLAGQILSLKDKDGKPMLAILSEDQGLPKYISARLAYSTIGEAEILAIDKAQQDMLASNFAKIIKEK